MRTNLTNKTNIAKATAMLKKYAKFITSTILPTSTSQAETDTYTDILSEVVRMADTIQANPSHVYSDEYHTLTVRELPLIFPEVEGRTLEDTQWMVVRS